ncbi:MAG: hypothetical protein JKY61_08830 [Planctomycetes bacterium]|nr:hypothetical protein [Planctomycetota bacterium]
MLSSYLGFVTLSFLLASCIGCAAVGGGRSMAPVLEGGLTEFTLSKAEPRGDFKVADLSWLEGRWLGEGLGGACEETWNPAMGGAMAGTFRLMTNDGEVNFYELMTLVLIEGRVVLRLVHLSADLTPWEKPGETTDFRLIDIQGTTAWFGGLTLHRDGKHLDVYVAMSQKAGGIKDVALHMLRQSR